jgi:molybdenum cofactor cytidylyltransferase
MGVAGMTNSLRVVEPPFTERDGAATVVGVVLAAGASSRFGDSNKLLAEWRDAPLVQHATRTLCDSTVDTVVVVTGHQADRVRSAVADLDVTVVHNEVYERGQATTVERGVTAARDHDADALLFALGDMPTVRPSTVDRLVAAYRAGSWTALAAAHEGTRGNPVLFDGRHFDALGDVTGDVGGRDILLAAEDAALVETGDPGVLLDIDRPADLDDL